MLSRCAAWDSFTAKLVKQCGPDALAGEEALTFLKAVFDRVLPTSTYVERMFARLARWSGDKRAQTSPVATCCQALHKHPSAVWLTAGERSRRNVVFSPTAKSNKHRPSWVKSGRQQQACTGLHLFSQDFLVQHPNAPHAREESGKERLARALRAWRLLSAQERQKQHWKRMARSRNHETRSAAAPVFDLVGGPWNAASSHGFPLSRHIVAKHMQDRKDIAENYKACNNALQPECLDSMDIQPECAYDMFARCSSRSCVADMTVEQKGHFDALVKLLIHAIVTFAPKPEAASEEPLILSFVACLLHW